MGELALRGEYGNLISNSCTNQKLVNSNFYFFPVVPEEIISVVSGLRNCGESGPDNLSSEVLKYISPLIAEHFSALINFSVSVGKFQAVLKQAVGKPDHKKGSVDDLKNYRPISLLSQLLKVIERIVCRRIYDYLSRIYTLTSCQHRFRAGRSTQSVCCEFLEFIYFSLDEGYQVARIFFDLTRAFDCLQPEFLVEKIYQMGLRGVVSSSCHFYFVFFNGFFNGIQSV